MSATLLVLVYLALLGVFVAACSPAPSPADAPQDVTDGSVRGGAAEAVSSGTALEADARPVAPEVAAAPQLPSFAPVAVPIAPTLPLWLQSQRPTPLLSSPGEHAERFTELPENHYLKLIEQQADWLLVAYGGDAEGRLPGWAWVRSVDVAPLQQPPQWVKNYRPTALWSGPGGMAERHADLPDWTWLELLGEERNGRLLVRDPGDGRSRLPGTAWVDAGTVGPVLPPTSRDVPQAYPATTQPGLLRLRVPYRSQLDGTPWEGANCGPVVVGMGLETLGISVSSTQLRREVLDAQQLWGDDSGSFIWALADVAERHGARALDLYLADGKFRRWTLDDARSHLEEGRPVIVQVRYRAIPGREDSPYGGDHYIVLTGLLGDSFLYNDSIDNDGVGFDRLMSPAQLNHAMDANNRKFAYAGFALERR